MRHARSSVLPWILLLAACGRSPETSRGPRHRVDLRVLPPEVPVAQDCPVPLALGMALLAVPILPEREGAVTISLEATCEQEEDFEPFVEVRATVSLRNEPDVRVRGVAEGGALPDEESRWDRALALARMVARALEDAWAEHEVLHLSEQEVAERLNHPETLTPPILFALVERAGRSSLDALVRLATRNEDEVAFRAVGVLGRLGGRDGAAALGRVAVEGGPEVALAAVRLLGELPFEEAERALEVVAGQSTRAAIRMRALWYLGRGPDRGGD